jgi:hypothetical protein
MPEIAEAHALLEQFAVNMAPAVEDRPIQS